MLRCTRSGGDADRPGDGTITVRNARHNGTIRAGGTTTLSYVASSSVTPTDFYLNGRSCQAG